MESREFRDIDIKKIREFNVSRSTMRRIEANKPQVVDEPPSYMGYRVIVRDDFPSDFWGFREQDDTFWAYGKYSIPIPE